jgi:hypothetical protein
MTFGERFLVHPALFPARLAGEPWGAQGLVLNVAGVSQEVSGLSASQAAALRERFAGFETRDDAGAVASRVFRMAPEEFRSFDTRGWNYDLDLDADQTWVRIAGLRFVARLAWRPVLTGALWTAASEAEFPGVFENYLRVLAAYGLTAAGGALVHSAGIVDAGEASLFVGVSGAGKSTLARLSLAEGRAVLSDDLNAVRPCAGGFEALAVPFAGDVRSDAGPRACPLRAVARLRQGTDHAVTPLQRGAAVAHLAACAPYVNRDRFRAERLMANLAALVASVDVQQLTFAPRAGVWDLVGREVRA